MNAISPRALWSDLTLELDEYLATIEFKNERGISVSHWIISGLAIDGLPAMLLILSMGMNGKDELELTKESKELGSKYVLPLVSSLPRTYGLRGGVVPFPIERRQCLFYEHASHHFSAEGALGMTMQLQTECLFRMATALQLPSPLKDIAEFQGVAVSTVQDRIKIARAKGRLPRPDDGRTRRAQKVG